MQEVNAIVLAAGKGTRMKSSLIKVLHKVAGKTILHYVIDTIRRVGIRSIYIVVGYQSEAIKESLGAQGFTYVEQKEQLGTGHAVQEVLPYLNEENPCTIILAGDCPLIKTSTINAMLEEHRSSQSSATILTTKMKNPTGYGRILRSESHDIVGIVEQKDCSDEQRLIDEINSGFYVFDTRLLIENLKLLKSNNKQNEYYLTDIIEILKSKGHKISSVLSQDETEVLGVNTRQDLAKVHCSVQEAVNNRFMNEGVTILDPSNTLIDSTVSIGEDTVVHPFSLIKGQSIIPKSCVIGASSYLENVELNEGDIIKPGSQLIKKLD